jgi:hypothetical protein
MLELSGSRDCRRRVMDPAPDRVNGRLMEAQPQSRPRPPIKERLKALVAEYGMLAIVVFIAISLLVFAGMYAAVSAGWRPESAAGTAGTLLTAYVAYRTTLLLRIAAAALVTPVVARAMERMGLRRRPPS